MDTLRAADGEEVARVVLLVRETDWRLHDMEAAVGEPDVVRLGFLLTRDEDVLIAVAVQAVKGEVVDGGCGVGKT